MATKAQKRAAGAAKAAEVRAENQQKTQAFLQRRREARMKAEKRRKEQERLDAEQKKAEKVRLAMLDMAGGGCGD